MARPGFRGHADKPSGMTKIVAFSHHAAYNWQDTLVGRWASSGLLSLSCAVQGSYDSVKTHVAQVCE